MTQCDYCGSPATKVDLFDGKVRYLCNQCAVLFTAENGRVHKDWADDLVDIETYEIEQAYAEMLILEEQ